MNQEMFDFGTGVRLYRVKSPLNYVGGKFKLLKQLMEPHLYQERRRSVVERNALIPNEINTFVDVFCGGFNVGANANAEKVIGIDADSDVIQLLCWMKENGSEKSVKTIKEIIVRYGLGRGKKLNSNANALGKTDLEKNPAQAMFAGMTDSNNKVNSLIDNTIKDQSEQEKRFYELRKIYNAARLENKTELDGFDMRAVLYTLIVHAFNGHIRFSPKGGYNIPYGERTFNDMLERNLAEFAQRLYDEKPTFINNSYEHVENLELTSRDYVYLDPPYLLSTAPYNESTKWCREDDKNLYEMLDRLDTSGIRFGISNVIEHKGERNNILAKWAGKYRTYHLEFDYDTASYNLKESEGDTQEVFVTNV